jgi:hypothetical protein
MSERKVLNKYFPPDFDPSRIGRRHKSHKGPVQQTVRLMAPFSMRCTTCGEYIYKGKKFNARKENANEVYLDIKVFRFHIRCTRCSAEIIFKTDPQNADYIAEVGAQRNIEPWREQADQKVLEEEEMKRIEEEENPMTKLEQKTVDSKREMEIMDALDEIRLRNARNERLKEVKMLAEKEDDEKRRREQEEDEEITRKAFEKGIQEVKDAIGSDTITELKAEFKPELSIKKRELPKKRDLSSFGISVVKKKRPNLV